MVSLPLALFSIVTKTLISFPPLQANVANIDVSQLSLSEARSKEVCREGCYTYRQFITCNDQKLVIQTANCQEDRLYCKTENDRRSINIPVPSWLRNQLNLLEKFVKENVKIPEDVVKTLGDPPKFKALWDRDRMYIGASNWCKYYCSNDNGFDDKLVSPDYLFGHGIYRFNIEVPYVYIGPHKDGSSFSLTLRIVQVSYRPLPLDSSGGELQCDCPFGINSHQLKRLPAKEPEKKKAKRTRKKKKNDNDDLAAMEFLESLVSESDL